ncbi:MAG: hypothetical protein FJZ47_14185 [Candidatus Tectomicrobia bacterium]|uniref:SRPBCC family protein n=1 Tax=Tectimicrobiota bacterium TaxID=2528274 RepID=A0A937W4F6_UNCTE|nr:hypothetical protein [Candidatus Tectomicrobia bacterium]
MQKLPPNRIAYITAVTAGVLYGVVCQATLRLEVFHELFAIMSFGFVFVLPVVLGVITLWFATPMQRASWLYRIFAPWSTVSVGLVVLLVVGWEGTICALLGAVVSLPLASLGGVMSGMLLARIRPTELSSSVLVPILLLPIVWAWLESPFPLPQQHGHVATAITIAAPASVVWANIIQVPKITEPLQGVFYRLGFPKPLEATLSHPGLGAVRHASFERGLVFLETIDVWEPEQVLSFAISVAPDSVPTTTLDEHVVVGGRYFDVLRGTYQLEIRSDQQVILHLASTFRVSTRFNFYARPWASFLMRDIQNTILTVLKSRCERQAQGRG